MVSPGQGSSGRLPGPLPFRVPRAGPTHDPGPCRASLSGIADSESGCRSGQGLTEITVLTEAVAVTVTNLKPYFRLGRGVTVAAAQFQAELPSLSLSHCDSHGVTVRLGLSLSLDGARAADSYYYYYGRMG